MRTWEAPRSFTILAPEMSASYSDALLEALNLNQRAYWSSIPSGEVSIIPAPLSVEQDDSSTCSSQVGPSMVGDSSSEGTVHSTMKSESAWPLIDALG